MTADKELKAFIDRILRLKEEQDAISGDIRDVYGEAKGRGYDKTVMGKVVAYLRKIEKAGSQTVDEQESIFETYLASYQGASGTRVATHTHETDYDRETGEVRDVNPRLAKQIVDGMQTEAGRAALVAAVDLMIEDEEEDQESVGASPATETSLSTREDSKSVVVGERSPVLAHTNSPETANDTPSADIRVEGREVGDDVSSVKSEDLVPGHQLDDAATSLNESDDDAIATVKGNATARLANVADVETSSSATIAPAVQGEAEAPAPTNVSPPVDERGGERANVGDCPDDQVKTEVANVTRDAALVSMSASHKPLRPLCLRPNQCGGYGDKTCHSCLVAARTTGEAA